MRRKPWCRLDHLSQEHRKVLDSLCPERFHHYFLDRDSTEGTCTWITQRPEFRDWLSDEPGNHKLWINSQPGYGKSYLAKHIITTLSSTSHRPIHCFLSSSSPGRGDLQSLMRATLQQALRLEPEMMRDLLPQVSPSLYADSKTWTQDLLTSHWPTMMANIAARHSLAIIVDGLDELQSECRAGFLRCLELFEERVEERKPETLKLDGTATPEPPEFRVILLSREDSNLATELSGHGFRSCVVTSQDTAEDLKSTVRAGLGKFWRFLEQPDHSSTADQEDKCMSIVERSDGCYTWATLVLECLNRRVKVVWQVRTLPCEMQDLYLLILEDYVKTQLVDRLLVQVLRWVLFQNTSLNPAEFNIAQALGTAMESSWKSVTGARKFDDLLGNTKQFESSLDENIKIRVAMCCGHLVKFQDDRLEFNHGDLRSVLLGKGSELFVESDFDLSQRASHATLADICISYLNMTYFDESGAAPTPFTMDMWESKVRRRIKQHPFVRYAALNWHKHMTKASPAWPGANAKAALDRMKRLVDGTTEHAKSWAEVWWFCTRGPTMAYPSTCPAALIVSTYDAEEPSPPPREESPKFISLTPEDTPHVAEAIVVNTSQDASQRQAPTSQRPDIPVVLPPMKVLVEELEKLVQWEKPIKEESEERQPKAREPANLPKSGPADPGPQEAAPAILEPPTQETERNPSSNEMDVIHQQTSIAERSDLNQKPEVKLVVTALPPDLLPQQAIPPRGSSYLRPDGGSVMVPPRQNSIQGVRTIPQVHAQQEHPAAQSIPLGILSTPIGSPSTKKKEKKKGLMPRNTKKEEAAEELSQAAAQPATQAERAEAEKRGSWWTRIKKAGKGLGEFWTTFGFMSKPW